MAPTPLYKLIFFVPPSSLQACKFALFALGAGTHPGSKYTHCSYETRGTGQFRAEDGANPAIGKVGEVEQVEEVKVEMLCAGKELASRAMGELRSVHPYEEPVMEVYRLEELE